MKMFQINPPIRTDQVNGSTCSARSHLRAGLGVAGDGSDGERGPALHEHVGGAQRAAERAHGLAALDAHAQGLLHGHVRQHGGGVGDGPISPAGQGVY